MASHQSSIDIRTYHHLATQLLSAVNNVEKKNSEKLIDELDRARTSVCNQIEKYSDLEADVQLNIVNVEIGIKNYFQK